MAERNCNDNEGFIKEIEEILRADGKKRGVVKAPVKIGMV
jgi:hypothetical protein